MYNELYQKCLNMSADEIYKYLFSDEIKNTEYLKKDNITYRVCDIGTLFVTAAYISEGVAADKNILRKNAYLALFNEDRSVFIEAWTLIGLLTDTVSTPTNAAKIRILKGGSYKIKNYYLENYLLNDIRGSSVLLTYVEETLIPSIIKEKYIPECIVYCGGGNIFAIVPESCDESFALELEEKGKELLISADIAYFVSEPMAFSDIMGNDYKRKMALVENALDERKKLIVNCSGQSKTPFLNKGIFITSDNKSDSFFADVMAAEIDGKGVCSACGKRMSYYSADGKAVCASCLHKRSVGRAARYGKYARLYEKYNGFSPDNVSNLNDIADREGYIAVVYGDGNNMGGIIQNFTKITQMMEFSRDVKEITTKAAFESMGERKMKKFEAVGLGGDDIFMITEGNKAIRFTISLIEKYNRQFEKYKAPGTVSTLSAGIAISKYDMPIQIILEKAEEELKRAKNIAKQKADNCGSLSFVVMDTFDGSNGNLPVNNDGIGSTMLPYYTDTASSVVEFAETMKSEQGKTRLRNILKAFKKAESTEEAELFLQYMNAKEKSDKKKIRLSDIEGYEKSVGYYIRDGRKYYIWDDLMNIIDYIE